MEVTGGRDLPDTMDGKPSFRSSDLGQQQAVIVMSPGSWTEPAWGGEESGVGQTQGEVHADRAVQKATEEESRAEYEDQGNCPSVLGEEDPLGEDQHKMRKEVEETPRSRQNAQGMSGEQVIGADGVVPDSLCLAEPYLSMSKRMRVKQQKGVGQHPQRGGDKALEEPRGPGPFFYFGGGNGASIVIPYCVSRGWQRMYDKTREDYKLKWCELKSSRTYYNFREGEQLVFQIPNNKVLTTKIGLLNSLREYDRVSSKVNHGRGIRRMKIEDFFPDTFRMDIKAEREAFFTQQEGLCPGKGNMWICKPTGLNQGRGIFLLQSAEDITAFRVRVQNAAESPANRKTAFRIPQAQIVQRYIQNPLLLKGKKFDVRSYFLIACTSPYVAFFRHGYVRLTCDLYDPNSHNLSAHLTNQYMQKKNPLYSVLKEETIWSMERFNLYINENFMVPRRLPRDWVLSVFAKRMQQIMTQCFLAVRAKLECKLGYFDLIGCDFMIDENFKVWLLEMNCNPALHTNCEVLKEVVPRTVTETLDLALEIFNKCRCGLKLLPLSSQRDFELLYCAESKCELLTNQRSRTAWPRATACPKKAHRPATMAPRGHSLVTRSIVGASAPEAPHHHAVPSSLTSLSCSSFSPRTSVCTDPPAFKPAEPRQNSTNETYGSSISTSTPELLANHTVPFAAGSSSISCSAPAPPHVGLRSHARQPLPRHESAEDAARSNRSTKTNVTSRSRTNKVGHRRVELCLSKCTWQQQGLTSDLRVWPKLERSKSTMTYLSSPALREGSLLPYRLEAQVRQPVCSETTESSNSTEEKKEKWT